jgi:hypothetical protein
MRASAGRIHKDVWGGSLIAALGGFVVAYDTRYTVGTLSHMGPGYFPGALGIILILTGAAIAAKGFVAMPPARVERRKPEWRAWLLISLSVIAFLVLAIYGGLIAAAFGIVFISAMADRDNTWRQAIVLGLVIAAVSIVLFHWALQLQIPLLSWG